MITPNRPEDHTDDARHRVPLTQLIHLMAEYQHLGRHCDTYLATPADDIFVRGCGIVAGTLGTIGIICLVVGAWQGGLPLMIFACVPLLLALRRGMINRQNRAARIDVFDFGVTVYRTGQRVAGFRWDTMEVRQHEIPFHDSATVAYHLELSGPGGIEETVADTDFARPREWARAIQSAVTATQLPAAVEEIDAGGTVVFGDVGLNLDALTYEDEELPWEAIQLIDARSGHIRLKVAGNWKSLAPVGTIPNFYIFNELAERLRLTPVS
ncbi:DUF6585 family protein [Nocardia camponoti]|uniref:Uncharacterized protein n=1 Tax=Nocardia camponoti TaxID=1616106 RepID=A0A917V8Y9_9NOCA|nr:DUF6585 family protein [Nocardia camponoti]GGK51536.1 hypothetical protein GCM10011591_24040 [Nocardia camponoti]